MSRSGSSDEESPRLGGSPQRGLFINTPKVKYDDPEVPCQTCRDIIQVWTTYCHMRYPIGPNQHSADGADPQKRLMEVLKGRCQAWLERRMALNSVDMGDTFSFDAGDQSPSTKGGGTSPSPSNVVTFNKNKIALIDLFAWLKFAFYIIKLSATGIAGSGKGSGGGKASGGGPPNSPPSASSAEFLY